MRKWRPFIDCEKELTGRRTLVIPSEWRSFLQCFHAAAKLALHVGSLRCSMGIAVTDAGSRLESSVDVVVGRCVGSQTLVYGFRHLLFVEHKVAFLP
jgi:hypothetical protein